MVAADNVKIVMVSELAERVQDILSTTLVAGANVTLTYNDTANTLTVAANGGGTGGTFDAEQARDVIGAALRGAGMVTVVADDANDTITVSGSQALTDALAAKAPMNTTNNRIPLINMPTGHAIRRAYAEAYAQSSRAAYLTSIGATGRTDFSITLYGQVENNTNGVVTYRDPDVPWLIDGIDATEIGPSA